MMPKNREPAHPGKILRKEFLQHSDDTRVVQLAKILDRGGERRAEAILNEECVITDSDAEALAEHFDTTMEFWVNLQNRLDSWNCKEEKE